MFNAPVEETTKQDVRSFLKWAKKELGGTKATADKLGVEPNYINMILRGERSLGTDKAHLLAALFGFTYIKMIERGKSIRLKNQVDSPRHTKKDDPREPEALDHLLQMTREVLTSKTPYAQSLEMNIKSFHLAVKNHPVGRGVDFDDPPDPPHPGSSEETGT